jgi:thiol-disulfide isomerase/thioredoxin
VTEPGPATPPRPPRRGLVGPFSGRQLLAVFGAVLFAAVALVALTTPLGDTGGTRPPPDPRATPFIIGEAPAEGLRPGDLAPEFSVELEDGTTYQLTDLDGQPVRLADLRGKAVWINFWASWCPPCQAETPVLRELAETYRDEGLELVAISVQETSADDVRRYAERYELDFTIGFDGSGHIFRSYLVYALPTQFFVGPDGVIRSVVQGPLDLAGATARIEQILPAEAAAE